MSFLSVAFLFALPLVAAPLLVHLFDRRRNAVIQWGAMDFLVEAAARKTSARKLKQWLLLLMRCLAIAALILALARPLMPAGYLGGDPSGETIFVVDNSMSMSRNIDSETLLDEAVEVALERMSTLPSRHDVRILTTAPYPIWVSPGSVRSDPRNRPWIRKQLESLDATQGEGDLLAALFTAVQAERKATQHFRNIVVLTDGQAADWRLDDQTGWKRLSETLAEASLQTNVETVHLADDETHPSKGNLGMDHVSLDRLVVGVDQPFTATATLQNYRDNVVNDCDLIWSVNDQQRHRQRLDPIEGRQSVQSNWTASFETAGTYRLVCHIDHDDDLTADNRSGLVVEVVDRIPVVIVENSDDLGEFQQDSYFVQAALGWIDGKALEGNSLYVPTVVSPDELASIGLSKQRVVVIPNLTRLTDDVVDRLAGFVEDGGGLWIGLGPRTDTAAFNQQMFADASGVSPLALDQIVDTDPPAIAMQTGGDANAERVALRIDPFREQHPATRRVADVNGLDLDDALIHRRFRFMIDEAAERTSVVLRLNNGEPLVVEHFLGRGRVIVQAVPLRLQWSDLAKTQAFVVMVRDWIDYLAEPRATQYNLEPGEPLVVRILQSESEASRRAAWEAAPTALLRPPKGEPIELAAGWLDDAYVFQSSRTRLPGDYELEIGLREQILPFYVRRSTNESNLDSLKDDARQRIAAATSVSLPKQRTAALAESRSDPVWPYLLLGLIVLISSELVLSGILARERFGSSGFEATQAADAISDPDHVEVDLATRSTTSTTGAMESAVTSEAVGR